MRCLPVRRTLTGIAILLSLAVLPSIAGAQGFGGQNQGGFGGGQGGGLSGGGFGLSGSSGFSGSGFGQGGTSFQGSGFGLSGTGATGSFLGSSQGFRPSTGTGLTNRASTNGASSGGAFGAFRSDPRSAAAATSNNGNGLGMNLGGQAGLGGQRLGNNAMGNFAGLNQFGMNRMGMGNMNRMGNMMGGNMMGGNRGMGMNQNMANTNQIAPGFVLRHNIATPPAAPPTERAARLMTVLQGSSSLPSLRNLTVQFDGDTTVLSGTVATDAEKTLSEAILRLEPGVYNIRNDLQVKPVGP